MVKTCPGTALRSGLYAALIRDSLQPLPKAANGETKSPTPRADETAVVPDRGSHDEPITLNSTPAETFNHRRGTT
jgi:hypothetical protein